MMNWGGISGHLGGLFHMILFYGFLLFAIIYLIMMIFGKDSEEKSKSDVSAIEILKRRYAAGEIEKHEYEEKLRDLES